MTAAMEAISASKEIYPPSAETVAQAKVPDYLALRQRAVEDRQGLGRVLQREGPRHKLLWGERNAHHERVRLATNPPSEVHKAHAFWQQVVRALLGLP